MVKSDWAVAGGDQGTGYRGCLFGAGTAIWQRRLVDEELILPK